MHAVVNRLQKLPIDLSKESMRKVIPDRLQSYFSLKNIPGTWLAFLVKKKNGIPGQCTVWVKKITTVRKFTFQILTF